MKILPAKSEILPIAIVALLIVFLSNKVGIVKRFVGPS